MKPKKKTKSDRRTTRADLKHTMRLRVRTKQGTNAIDDVEPSSLVSDLKRRLYCTGRVDVPPEEQRLVGVAKRCSACRLDEAVAEGVR